MSIAGHGEQHDVVHAEQRMALAQLRLDVEGRDRVALAASRPSPRPARRAACRLCGPSAEQIRPADDAAIGVQVDEQQRRDASPRRCWWQGALHRRGDGAHGDRAQAEGGFHDRRNYAMIAVMRRALLSVLLLWVGAGVALAQSNLAPGFAKLPPNSTIALMPVDVELFEISAGGVIEPRADWTAAATKNIMADLRARKVKLGARATEITGEQDEAIEALNNLHGAVSRAIVVHHFGRLKLPTKDGKLDWTLGPDAAKLREKSGADYALFTWVRDSYASAERKAMMVVGALLGVGHGRRRAAGLRLARRPAHRSNRVVQPHRAWHRGPARSPSPPARRSTRCSPAFRSEAMQRRPFLLGCGCLALAAAAGVRADEYDYQAPPRFSRPDPSSDEGGLWAYMDRQEQQLKRSSFLIRDPALNKYVSDIACRLAGEHCPEMRVYLVRTPYFNASMAPNGMMQVWSGLLVRMQNEAQLSAVLGHEIGHYLQRHSVEGLRDAKSRSSFAQILGIALGVVGGRQSRPARADGHSRQRHGLRPRPGARSGQDRHRADGAQRLCARRGRARLGPAAGRVRRREGGRGGCFHAQHPVLEPPAGGRAPRGPRGGGQARLAGRDARRRGRVPRRARAAPHGLPVRRSPPPALRRVAGAVRPPAEIVAARRPGAVLQGRGLPAARARGRHEARAGGLPRRARRWTTRRRKCTARSAPCCGRRATTPRRRAPSSVTWS